MNIKEILTNPNVEVIEDCSCLWLIKYRKLIITLFAKEYDEIECNFSKSDISTAMFKGNHLFNRKLSELNSIEDFYKQCIEELKIQKGIKDNDLKEQISDFKKIRNEEIEKYDNIINDYMKGENYDK